MATKITYAVYTLSQGGIDHLLKDGFTKERDASNWMQERRREYRRALFIKKKKVRIPRITRKYLSAFIYNQTNIKITRIEYTRYTEEQYANGAAIMNAYTSDDYLITIFATFKEMQKHVDSGKEIQVHRTAHYWEVTLKPPYKK